MTTIVNSIDNDSKASQRLHWPTAIDRDEKRSDRPACRINYSIIKNVSTCFCGFYWPVGTANKWLGREGKVDVKARRTWPLCIEPACAGVTEDRLVFLNGLVRQSTQSSSFFIWLAPRKGHCRLPLKSRYCLHYPDWLIDPGQECPSSADIVRRAVTWQFKKQKRLSAHTAPIVAAGKLAAISFGKYKKEKSDRTHICLDGQRQTTGAWRQCICTLLTFRLPFHLVSPRGDTYSSAECDLAGFGINQVRWMEQAVRAIGEMSRHAG